MMWSPSKDGGLNFSGNPEVGKHTLHSSDTTNSKLTSHPPGNLDRGSSSESSDNKAHSVHKPRHWDDPSVASEVVMFKGHASRRSHREAFHRDKIYHTVHKPKRETVTIATQSSVNNKSSS